MTCYKEICPLKNKEGKGDLELWRREKDEQ